MSRLLLGNQTPYGAYELKATYQRNMLCGTLIMLLFVSLIILAGLTYQYYQPPIVVIDFPPRPPIEWPNPLPDITTSTPEPPVGGGGGKKIEMPLVIDAKPNPVPMEEISSEEDNLISSQTEISSFLKNGELIAGMEGEGDGSGEGEGSGLGNRIMGKLDDEIPMVTDYRPHEVKPAMISESSPEYPRLAKTAGMEGDVWISAFVDKNGDVKKAIVARSSGINAGFDEAAVASAYLCKYKPAIQNSYPIGVWVTYKVVFRLKEAN